MRYSAGHAAATRERLLDLAADALQTRGLDGLGVQPLMRAAGMTHGGFYQHFASRDALVAAAVGHVFARSSGVDLGDDPDPRRRLSRFVRGYLSPAHVVGVERGCPLPALAGEARRLEGEAAATYHVGADRIGAKVAGLLTDAGVAAPQETARSVLAELVGAVTLARLAPDAAARDVILDATRDHLLERLGLKK